MGITVAFIGSDSRLVNCLQRAHFVGRNRIDRTPAAFARSTTGAPPSSRFSWYTTGFAPPSGRAS